MLGAVRGQAAVEARGPADWTRDQFLPPAPRWLTLPHLLALMPRPPRLPSSSRRRIPLLRPVGALVGALAVLAAACGGRRAGRPAAPLPASATSTDAHRLLSTLDAHVPALLADNDVASVSVAVIEGGQVVLERAYGEQSPGVPATPGTLYNLASNTKPVTAETLLRLAAAGRLALDEPMASAWVDPDVAADPRAQRLTVRHALAHQTGLPNWRDKGPGRGPGDRLAFTADPGTTWGYSGEGYDYAARFAERKLGRSFEDLAREVVFSPLGMTSTAFSRRAWMQGRLAVPRDTGGRWGEPQVTDSGTWSAANNLITTAGDYGRFVAAVMRGDGLPATLAAERLRAAPGPQPPPGCHVQPAALCPSATRMALGWVRLEYADGPVLLHGGHNERPGGEWTTAYFDPRRRRGLVILTSGARGNRVLHGVATLVDPGAPVVAFLRPPE